MLRTSCRGQILIELVLCLSFFLLIGYFAHLQNIEAQNNFGKHRFGKQKQRNSYVTKKSIDKMR